MVRAYGRGVLGGIADYVRAHGTWKIYQTERRLCDGPPGWLKTWNGDGIIARIETWSARQTQMNLPVVDLFEHRNGGGVRCLTDNCAIARLAAEHLIAQGLEHFAYCGLPASTPPRNGRGILPST